VEELPDSGGDEWWLFGLDAVHDEQERTLDPLLALLLSVELLNRAVKRHRFQAATFHSSHIPP
jgi:hypothetical protein